MSTQTITLPDSTEYAPFYGRYIALVREGDAVAALERQIEDAMPLLRGIPESKGDHRYAPGKWTLKEVLGHLIDSERVFAYRALRFARADRTALAGFDENQYVPAGQFGRRSLAELATEFEAVRRANLHLFRGLDAEAWMRRGVANDREISVRALAYIIAGHGRHHVGMIEERYLK